MQSGFSKLILSSLANEFLKASNIQLAIFLFILLFKYFCEFFQFFFKKAKFEKFNKDAIIGLLMILFFL